MRLPRNPWTVPTAALLAAALPVAGPLVAESSPAAEAVVKRMIAAHGGMERWASAPTVQWEETFVPAGAEGGLTGKVTVEQGRRRAYLDYPSAQIVWDGERAWSVNWQGPTPPRFLALLNYHFLNLPWLTRDPGVNLGEPGGATLWDDPTEYVTVKVTYDRGVGDTPDDYYVLYVHPETWVLHACEYIVTYDAILPEGADSTDPHILVYDEHATVSGLLVPTHYSIYELDGSPYATATIANWSFTQPFDESRMLMPEEAVVDTSTP